MDAEKVKEIVEEIDYCVEGLERVSQEFKKRGKMSLVERMSLGRKALASLEELKTQREKLAALPPEASDEEREAQVQEAREAIGRIGKMFGPLLAAQNAMKKFRKK
jgi:hypothetical protein